MRRLLSLLCTTLLVTPLALGCEEGTDLEPADSVDDPATRPHESTWLEDAAVTELAGVTMTIQEDEWPGAAQIKEDVTPVRLVIENRGEVPLRVRYDQFELIEPDGTIWSALPPFQINGEVRQPVFVREYERIEEPAFEFDDAFFISPVYEGIYAIDPYEGEFEYDYGYYETYGPYWANMELPTSDMLRYALPEGVIEPGGTLSGYIYFEHIPEDSAEKVWFDAELVNAKDGRTFGGLRVPFEVD